MSELIVEEEPEPLSGFENIYPVNYQTDLSYDAYELSAYYHEIQTEQQERQAVGQLTIAADRVLRDYALSGDPDDRIARQGDAFLRRREIESVIEGRIVSHRLYFFVDRREGQDYCRSWSQSSGQVNWCYNESRHEPASDVANHLLEVFPPPIKAPRRVFGGRIIARVMSRNS